MGNPLEPFNATQWGKGAKTVVLAHGFGTNQHCWREQRNMLLALGYRVITFDFAGATPTSMSTFNPLRHQTLYGFAEDVIMLLDSLAIRHAIYIGHSMGGMVGVLAQNGNPELFDAMILLGASARYIDSPGEGYIGGFQQHEIDNLLQSMQSNYAVWANGFAPLVVGQATSYLSHLEFTHNLLQLRPDVAHAVLKAAFLSDHLHDVIQLKTPLYVLQTKIDHAVPIAAAQWLAQHGQACQLIEIQAEGHLPHLTTPDLVNSAITQCLNHYENSR